MPQKSQVKNKAGWSNLAQSGDSTPKIYCRIGSRTKKIFPAFLCFRLMAEWNEAVKILIVHLMLIDRWTFVRCIIQITRWCVYLFICWFVCLFVLLAIGYILSNVRKMEKELWHSKRSKIQKEKSTQRGFSVRNCDSVWCSRSFSLRWQGPVGGTAAE